MSTSTYPIDASTPAVVLKFDPNVMHHGGLGVSKAGSTLIGNVVYESVGFAKQLTNV